MRRALVALVGLLLAWLGFASFPEAAAVADPPPVASCPYETHAHTAATVSASPERGPPTGGYAYDAIDRWSLGSMARVGAVTGPTTAYPVTARSLQAGGTSATTSKHAGRIVSGLPSLHKVQVAANGADNAVNGVRLGQQLARESAGSVFTSSGRLTSGAIQESQLIIRGSDLGNKQLVRRLTADGSDIADWGKYTTRTHQSPSGNFQVHYYMNRSTGAIDYGYDYKVLFGRKP